MRRRTPTALVLPLVVASLLSFTGIAHADSTGLADADAYNSAQASLVTGDYAVGLDKLAALTQSNPDDANIVALQAFYASASGDDDGMDAALTRLATLDPELRELVDRALTSIATAAEMDIDYAPVLDGSNTAIVVLGYGLLPDGTMRDELVDRLGAGLAGAEESPDSPIIVTGGNPQNGVAESDAMSKWLLGRGIDAARIHVERQASQTPQNASLSTAMLPEIGATEVALATSSNHIRRATSDFLVAGATVVGALPMDAASLPDVTALPITSRLGLTVDATKVIGVPRKY